MLEVLAFVLAGVALVVAVELIAERTGLPTAVLLTAAGLVYAVLPGPNLHVAPAIVFTFVLPPLIYSAALNASLIEVRRNLVAIGSRSVGLVIVTAAGVGAALHAAVPGLTLAAAVALGAAVAPPDPVAALAVGRRAGIPHRLVTLIEGEGLLNDATALTVFTVALTAATEGGLSPASPCSGSFGRAWAAPCVEWSMPA